MPSMVESKLGVCLTLTRAISKSRTVEEIYDAALDALDAGLGRRARRSSCSTPTA